MNYHFKIHKQKVRGYWAECVELEGCRTQGGTLKELRDNMHEALNLFLSEPQGSKYVFPKPKKSLKGKDIVAVPVLPSVAIANRVRELRLHHDLTQKDMKDRLGIKNLSNYQRLEDPQRANPEWKTLLLIKQKFPVFRVDDLME